MLRVNFVRKEILVFDAVNKPLFEGLLPLAKKGKNGNRDWSAFSDKELVTYAQKFVEKNGIETRTGLCEADAGLYLILKERSLLGKLKLKLLRRNWASMTDEQLVSHAQRFIQENIITRRGKLEKADSGLYDVLLERELIEKAIPEKRKTRPWRFWTSMSDEDIVSQALAFIEKNKIGTKSRLHKEDSGLAQVLRRRGLLEAVFAPLEQKKQNELCWQLAEAVDSYTETD
ncbi:MAG: hypothetical protein MN733_31825 [Nitrososphaera sp.]|nr:hypothetical protein [Nitrososphaera sp.]